MTVKDELHELLDQLDEEDDPLSEEEFARVRGGEAAIAAGDYVTLEQLRCLGW